MKQKITLFNYPMEQTAKKYLYKKRFLIKIFKRNRNMIKKLLQTSKLITSTITSSDAKMIRKEHRKKNHAINKW